MQHPKQTRSETTLSRRTLVHIAVCAGATVAGTAHAGPRPSSRPPGGPVAPPSTITSPPRDFSPMAPRHLFLGPGRDCGRPELQRLGPAQHPIQRLWTGLLWAEGPAWNAQGRYLVWSDIPNNRQMRWLEDDGHVSVFRAPSNNSNGNTFDFQGRQLSCEHFTRRVVRYEHDGTVTVLADRFDGKRLNSPNDVVAASRWQLLVHRPALWRPALRRHAGRGGRPEQSGREAQSADRPAGRDRRRQARTADQLLPHRSERSDRPGRHRRPGARSQRPLLLARLQEALRRQHRQGTGRHRPGRQGRHLCVRCRQRQQALQPQAVQRLHDRRREMRARRRALPTSTATSGARAMPAARSATAASPCSRPTAS